MSKQEIVMIFLGQAGVQVGNSVWELMCLEHGVRPNGNLVQATDGTRTVFSTASTGASVARALMIDLEPSVIDNVRSGSYRNLFNRDFLVSGKEDAANNFARGYYTLGRGMCELAEERLRRLCESCQSMQGFLVFRSFGGGTGSGLTSRIMQRLYREYPKLPKLEFAIFPAPHLSSVIVEPYNCILTMHRTIDTIGCTFLMDNEAIYGICNQKLDILRPTFINVNRIVAQAVSSVTSGLRFSGSLNSTLRECLTNLIPYPRIRFPIVSTSTLLTVQKANSEVLSASQLVSACIARGSQLVNCDPIQGRVSSICFMCRGELSASEVNTAVNRLRSSRMVTFNNFTPTGVKVGFCGVAPAQVPRGELAATPGSVIALINSTAISSVLKRVSHKYRLMFAKKAFVHHYIGEGMEEGEFITAHEDMKGLEREYRDLEKI